MARAPRFLPPGQPQHVVKRGNNRAPIFFDDADRRFYLTELAAARSRYGVAVHAYVLMSNHVHLLASPATSDALPRALQWLGSRYARHMNQRYLRTGTLWEGRYHAALLDSDEYFWTCSRYIELNPVRAGMVSHPREYPWSSFSANALGKTDPLVTRHELYELLGEGDAARCRAYRALFETAPDPRVVNDIREATQRNRPLGGGRFRGKVAKVAGRVMPSAHGGRRAGAGRPQRSRWVSTVSKK